MINREIIIRSKLYSIEQKYNSHRIFELVSVSLGGLLTLLVALPSGYVRSLPFLSNLFVLLLTKMVAKNGHFLI